MNSPITGSSQVTMERSISTAFIEENYQSSYGIDISSLFQGLDKIDVLRCTQSGFRFFSPSRSAGDSAFYESLQEFPWYYMDWKWEHEMVEGIIEKGSRILELGCAKGAFIQRVKSKAEVVGLELNKDAVRAARENGLDVRQMSIQDHARSQRSSYDMVCSFQVMEHVTDIKGIIEASLEALKPGGRLVISVPNNDSFIKEAPNSILNLPPHHMGLWDEASLSNLVKFFPMKLKEVYKEPLQRYHFPVVFNNKIEKMFGRGLLSKAIKKVSKWTKAYNLVGLFKKQITGHSIMMVYEKK